MTTQAERTAAPAFAPATARATVGVVVVTYDSEAHLDRLIGSLRHEAAGVLMRVVVVDNGSSDGTLARARAHEDVVTVAGHGNLGYAGGINVGLMHLMDVDAVLVLNPDLVVEPGAVAALLQRLQRPRAGIVLPLLLDEDGAVTPSLRREPTVARSLGDAVLGRHLGDRPGWLSETVRDTTAYAWPHPVDWGTGAAMLIRAEVVWSVGDWDERFFLYSEETDYCRRAREAGWEVWFEPGARVRHAQGGSGSGPQLTALLQVNRVRYARKHRSAAVAGATLAVTALGSAARTWDPGHRSAVGALLVPARRRALPQARPTAVPPRAVADPPAPTRGAAAARGDTSTVTGTVVVPAHDEATVVGRLLGPVAPWAQAAGVEVLVVANGCSDATAAVARSYPGVRVLELGRASKSAALAAGDDAARSFPRVYVDADVRADPVAIAATLRALGDGPWMAARPPAVVDAGGASAVVRAYLRARRRLGVTRGAMWGAGIYGLSETGHARLGRFPGLVADDLWVDRLFAPAEKTVVAAPPVRVAAPRTARSLLRVLRRTYRGNAEVHAALGRSPRPGSLGATATQGTHSTRGTAGQLLRTVRGPRSAVDAGVYAALVTLARVRRGPPVPGPGGRPAAGARWGRGESNRRGRPARPRSPSPPGRCSSRPPRCRAWSSATWCPSSPGRRTRSSGGRSRRSPPRAPAPCWCPPAGRTGHRRRTPGHLGPSRARATSRGGPSARRRARRRCSAARCCKAVPVTPGARCAPRPPTSGRSGRWGCCSPVPAWRRWRGRAAGSTSTCTRAPARRRSPSSRTPSPGCRTACRCTVRSRTTAATSGASGGTRPSPW